MKREIIGHTRQRELLCRLLSSDHIPNTLLFSGSVGTGKSLVAHEVAQSLLCERFREAPSPHTFGGCGECKGCTLVSAHNHPDCTTIDIASAEGGKVESLRALMQTIQMRTFLGGARVVILDHCDDLSLQGANLLLKSLEEPRPGNYFILVCSNPGALPQTLLSRCQIWFFDRLTDDEVRQFLERTTSPEEAATLAPLADGSLGNSERIRENLEQWTDLSARLTAISQRDLAAAVRAGQELSKDKDRLPTTLHLLRILARERLFTATSDEMRSVWATLMANLVTAERLIFERNLSASTVLTTMFSALAERPSLSQLRHTDSLLERIVV